MAYPVSTATLSNVMADIDQRLINLKAITQRASASSAAGQLNMDEVRRYYDFLISTNVGLIAAAGVPGIESYINTQKGTVSNAVAELAAIRVKIIETLDWLRANVPGGTFGGNPYKLAFVFPDSNTTQVTALTFTAPQTAGFRTVVDAMVAMIA